MQDRLSAADRVLVQGLQKQISDEPDAIQRDDLFVRLGGVMSHAQAFDEFADSAALPPDYRGHNETWTDVLRRQAQGIDPAQLTRITSPVLMVHGEYDPHPGREIHATPRTHVSQLDYISLPRCGHRPWLERHASETFLGITRAWLTDSQS